MSVKNKSITAKNSRVRSVSLSIESEFAIREIKKQSEHFNLSKFVDDCIRKRFDNIDKLQKEVILNSISVIQAEIDTQTKLYNKKIQNLQDTMKLQSTKLKLINGEEDW